MFKIDTVSRLTKGTNSKLFQKTVICKQDKPISPELTITQISCHSGRIDRRSLGRATTPCIIS